MSVVDRPTFARACRGATTETLTDFVAALYDARGWTVERAEGAVELTDAEGNRRRLVVRPEDDTSAVDADIVVAPAGGEYEGVSVVDVEGLYQQLNYAVERETARELLASQFELSPSPAGSQTESAAVTTGASAGDDDATEPRPTDESPRPTGSGSRPASPTRPLQVVAVAGLVIAVLVAAVLAGGATVLPLGQPADGADGADTPGVPTSTATPTATPTPPLPATATAGESTAASPGGRTPVSEELLVDRPPGIGANGSVDAGTVAQAHYQRLRNTTYTLHVTIRQFDGETLTSSRTETIRDAGDTLTTSVSQVGTGPPSAGIVGDDTDSGGSGEQRIENVSDAGGLLARSSALLQYYMTLSAVTVQDREVTDDRTLHRVTFDESYHPELGAVNGTAFVTDAGLVRFARWSFGRSDGSGQRVVVTMRVTAVGATSVPPDRSTAG